MPLACRIYVMHFFCEYLFTHIGYWKIFVLVQCGDKYCYGNEDQSWSGRSTRKSMFQQIWSNIAHRLKDIFVVSYNLWHNHPFDLVWFYAHTICIFIRTASEFIIFRGVNKNLQNILKIQKSFNSSPYLAILTTFLWTNHLWAVSSHDSTLWPQNLNFLLFCKGLGDFFYRILKWILTVVIDALASCVSLADFPPLGTFLEIFTSSDSFRVQDSSLTLSPCAPAKHLPSITIGSISLGFH